MPRDVLKQINAFHERLVRDNKHRYKSWEHCFLFFQNRESSKETAALHLAFYLASWGMYRGSSFLLQKDYTIHVDAVAILQGPNCRELWESVYDIPASKDNELICSLSEALRKKYREYIPDEKTRRKNPTDTLLTKILLGTIGCTPACDRFFRNGCRACQLSCPSFGDPFLRQMVDFCEEHADQLLEVQRAILNRGGVRYPIMKLVDMYFWEIGYQLSPEFGKRN